MGVMDYFKPVPTRSVQQVRELLARSRPGEHNLLDVRQPEEYEQGHIPGAILTPLGELRDRLAELDPGKSTVAYCASGVRSRAAASVLARAGFAKVYSMKGGIKAWDGLVAQGPPEFGMTYFPEASSVEEIVAVLWVLEEGSRAFYQQMGQNLSGLAGAWIFDDLADDEQEHQQLLAGLYGQITGREPDADFVASVLTERPDEPVMEGGLRVSKALDWARYMPLRDVLELAMAFEANAHDLHLRMARRESRGPTAAAFNRLAEEEKEHLERLASRLKELL